MPETFHAEEDEKTLERVIALAKTAKSSAIKINGGLPPDFEHYISQVVRYATGEDRNWDEPETLLERAVEAWEASAVRAPGEHIVSLRAQASKGWRAERLVLDIITDDRPFLVDSISGALTDAGKPVSFFVNAVIDTHRDDAGERAASGEVIRESLIHAEMDPAIDDAEVEALRASIDQVLADVSLAVSDWEPMRARLGACIAQLERARAAGVDVIDQREAVDFLKWLWDNRFAFLGVRRYDYKHNGAKIEFARDEAFDLGILKDAARRVLKSTYSEHGDLSPAVEDFLQSGEPILIAKANATSLVHRRVYMDYIGVKSYSVSGEVTGEDRFVGLFTAEAYNRPASDIPLLREKVRKVVERAGFVPGGHNEKALINILETFPRDEMFQVDVETLAETSLGILRLYKRPRVKLFMRRDRFDRFISALVFIPRDRFNSDVRESIGRHLADTFNGRVSAFYPSFGDATLVRVHFIIGIDPGAPAGPGLTQLTRDVRALCLEWRDGLRESLRDDASASAPMNLFNKWENAFSASYREQMSVDDALDDIAHIEALGDSPLSLRVYRKPGDDETAIRIKLYSASGPIKLSKLIPIYENLGLSVVQEAGYQLSPAFSDHVDGLWMHDFHAEEQHHRAIDVDGVKRILEDAMTAVLAGEAEDDAFNALVIASGLTWREASLLRAAARHHMQAGFAFSQDYMAEALANHAGITRSLIGVFHARFNPEGVRGVERRRDEVEAAEKRVVDALEQVSSLDEDRIIRRYLTFFAAVTRTNFYQSRDDGSRKPCISFKIDSAKIAELPDPKPFREIFVSGPRVDGVHLRFGAVARGGLRWSDRREDFRTEVLGLVKAQRVKNAVIVPAGSKGGFYPKQLPAGGDRGAIYEEGREAYKEFIRGLLDVTDNIVAGNIVPPKDVVVWDDDDPYLVVAADKGTAQFSDTANAISEEYGFWLGDAFASGGSAGYDHKVMGITARGAWEAVKRHFREKGKDIQTEPFTAAGVGDMSGDVFGNGMLLSRQTRLIAAFDYRDIFIDPDPDPATSYEERLRLFEAPQTSWKDYSEDLISKGGGVFSRNAKSIPLTNEMKTVLGLSSAKATPNEIISAILRMKVELFWLGGIGTYFKSAEEEHWQVGDRASDSIRINAHEAGAEVIGEGANLGLTQDARIEFARAGGRINTDAIDNSAGVDSSDHEVNIKILLSSVIERKELDANDRNDLLSAMTEDVARHVLIHNYEQTRALSQRESSAAADLDSHMRLMNALERSGRLDRALERLPDMEEIAELRAAGKGLTRPEIAVLLAYSKNWLFEQLTESTAPDDPALESELVAYFPQTLHQYAEAIASHRLRREIIATRLANEIVDTCGPSFPFRAADATGASLCDIALAYEAARRVLNLGAFAKSVDALDNKIHAGTQIELYNAASVLLREQMYRIASDARTMALLESKGIAGVTSEYTDPIASLKVAMPTMLPPHAKEILQARAAEWRDRGAPEEIALEAALMPTLELAFDIVNLANDSSWPIDQACAVFFAAGEKLSIGAVRQAARNAPRADYYEKIAMRRLTEDLAIRQSTLARDMIEFVGKPPAGGGQAWIEDAFAAWRESDTEGFSRFDRFITEIEISSGITVAKLSLLNRKLFDLGERLRASD